VPSPRATPDVHVLAVLRAHPRLLLTPERVTELQALASSDPQCAALVAAQARRADHALTPPLPTRRLAVAEDETELAQRLIQRAYAHMPIALAAYAPAGGYQIVGAIGPVRWTWITRAHISLAADGRQAVLSENGRQLTRALHSALPATGCVVDDWLPPSVAEHQNEGFHRLHIDLPAGDAHLVVVASASTEPCAPGPRQALADWPHRD